jgi:hypothetical protein
MTPRPTTPHFLLIPLILALVSGLALALLLATIQPVISVVIGFVVVWLAFAARRIGLNVPGAVRGWIGTTLVS